ncbi:hypothetical protein MPSEU_000485100 [Mayamaea pseudoterrestris]|nr:hypothetical protein MPSEU_000485100 [Mayamaea pseudoterrestris]
MTIPGPNRIIRGNALLIDLTPTHTAMNLRRLDAFNKTRPDLQQKTAVGGIITVLAACTAALLFLGQLYGYFSGATHHALKLSRSISIPLIPVDYHVGSQGGKNAKKYKANPLLQHVMAEAGKINLNVHVSFPHLQCDQLDVIHDGASLLNGELEKVHGKHALTKRPPSRSEIQIMGLPSTHKGGCTLEGHLRPYIVAGVLQITISSRTWAEATSMLTLMRMTDGDKIGKALERYNVSHYIHSIEFGRTYSGSAAKPLMNRAHMIENDYGGIAVESITVKLVPTLSHGFIMDETTYQTSVVEHTIHPQTLVAHGVPHLPGLVLSYDFTPLTVDLDADREGFLIFLSNLISIVAGVFVTVSLVTGCLVQSAAVVAKKID